VIYSESLSDTFKSIGDDYVKNKGYVIVKCGTLESCGFEEIPEALLNKAFYRK